MIRSKSCYLNWIINFKMVQTPEKRKFLRLRERDNEIQRQERVREARRLLLRLQQEHLARRKNEVDLARAMEWLRRIRENNARERQIQSK